MALKKVVSNIEEVPEALRSEYKAVEGKGFVLDLEGDDQEDVGALKRAHERVKEELREAKEAARRRGEDVTALESSYKEKLETSERQWKESVKATEAALRTATKGRTASELSAKLSATASDLLLPHIEKRLKVEIDGDRPLVRVLDKEGKMSAMSISDLEKELREDTRFASVITASRASGSGAGSDRNPGSQGGASGEGTPFNPNTATPAQLAAWVASRNKG